MKTKHIMFVAAIAAITTLGAGSAKATSVMQCPPITFEKGWAKKVYDENYAIVIAQPVSSRPVYYHDREQKYSFVKGTDENSNVEGKEPSLDLWRYEVRQVIKGDASIGNEVNVELRPDAQKRINFLNVQDITNTQQNVLLILGWYGRAYPAQYTLLDVNAYQYNDCLFPLMTPVGKGTPAQQFLNALQEQLKTTKE